jgi:hypothetical protein
MKEPVRHNNFARRCLLAALLATVGLPSVTAAVVNVNCGNSAEDTRKLNDAIANSRTGDSIQIHGTCVVNETIVLYGNRSYLGDSRTGTIIRQADGANLPALVASDSWNANAPGTGGPIRIAHMKLDGNRARNTGTSNLVIRSWLTVIEDVHISNAPADGIRLTNVARNGETFLTSTQVNGRISNCFIERSGANGIHVVDPRNSLTDWDLLDSWIASSGESGIAMDNAAGWKIAGNHVYGVQQNAIWAHRCYGTTIADNYVEDFGRAGGESNTWYGIACTVQGGAASVIRDNKVFRFNRETKGNFVYIGIPRVNQGTGVINVIDNVIRGAGGEHDIGLSYQVGQAAGLMVMSSGNNVQFTATPRSCGDKVTLVNSL